MVVLRGVSHLLALWAHFYGRATAVSATVTDLHLGGVLILLFGTLLHSTI